MTIILGACGVVAVVLSLVWLSADLFARWIESINRDGM